ncbi:MAG TPA: hypothetical protein VJ773_05620 [Gemmatimonadales bacterium]|nr:hypothetical protein [Gemmatimonadales bacterium]
MAFLSVPVAQVEAQLPDGCSDSTPLAVRARRTLPLGPAASEWVAALAGMLDATAPQPHGPPKQLLDSVAVLWLADSLGVEAALAQLVVDELGTTGAQARQAAALYRRFSGRTAPLLRKAPLEWSFSRLPLIVASIRVAESPAAADLLFGLACIAAWHVEGFRTPDGRSVMFAGLGWVPPWERLLLAIVEILPAERSRPFGTVG